MIGALNDRKVMVTGGSRGIGAACVKALVNAGAVVGFTYLSGAAESRSLERSMGGRAFSYQADVRDIYRMEEVVQDLTTKPGNPVLDGLVVNAGIYHRAGIADIGPEQWRRTMSVNLDGAFNCVKVCIPYMDRGSIVMVSSQLAHRGSGHGADYAASKAGLLGLSRSLAIDLAPDIRVNTVSPGYVDTDILSDDSEEKRSKRISQVPLGRIADPEEVAGPIVFLLTDEASYITGTDLDINGGLYIH